MRIGEFNLGIREGDTVSIHFDEKHNVFYFHGKLPNSFVWLKTMRLFTAIEKTGFDREYLGNASTFASIIQNNRLGAKYGFEIHVHTYFINKILPEMLRHDFGEGIKRAEEYQNTIKDVESHLERAKTAAMDTQGMQIGKSYASDYEEARKDYEALTKEWQEIAQKYQRELQELNRLASHANAVIFSISLSSDVRIVPDGSAVALALNECLDELNMRCETVLKDAYMQHFSFREVRQPYFFFMTELSGMFNPSMLALKASDPYFLELFKGLFPNLNATSVLQSNLDNMRHLTSIEPSEILRKMLLQMEIATQTFIPPSPQATQQGTQPKQEIPERDDILNEGELLGMRVIDDDAVRINLRDLDSHILIEGFTGRGKSSFARLLASVAIDIYKMNVITMDTSYHWSTLFHKYNGKIFDKKLEVKEALAHQFSLCAGRTMNTKELEANFLRPFYEYIKETRGMQSRKDKDILLIVDEAQNFGDRINQGVLSKIISELLKYGVIVLLITQFRKNLSKSMRSQAGLRFNTQVTPEYYEDFKSLFGIEIADSMRRVKKYNLYVQSADFNNWFEMKPLRLPDMPELKPEEIEKCRYTGVDAPKPEPIKQEPKAEVKAERVPQKEPIIEKPMPETKVELTKPIEPKKEGWDLTELQKKALKALYDNPEGFKSYNQWFISIGRGGYGETETNVRNVLRDRGYIQIIDPDKKKIGGVRITEKGKTVF